MKNINARPPRSIVLVTTRRDMIAELDGTLEKSGFQVAVTGTTEYAIRLLQDGKVDLMVCDVELGAAIIHHQWQGSTSLPDALTHLPPILFTNDILDPRLLVDLINLILSA